MATRTLLVVTAGLSEPSSTRLLADRLSAAAAGALHGAGSEPQVEVLELRDYAQDLTNNLLTGFPSPRLRAAIQRVISADGLICVSPIFNASYSGLFKLFWDVLERDSLAGKPVSIAATGGTARHSLALEHALRPLFSYLNGAVMPTAVYAATEDGGSSAAPVDGDLVDRIQRAGAELAAAISGSPPRTPVDPLDEPTPFEEMLHSVRSGGDA